jgi:hypothetical protein
MTDDVEFGQEIMSSPRQVTISQTRGSSSVGRSGMTQSLGRHTHEVFATNHALVGAALGALIDSPVKAAAAGVVSHAVMDAIPHWGVADRHGNARDKRIFYAVAVTDGLALAAVGVGLLKHRSLPMLAGAAGGDRRAAVARRRQPRARRHPVGREAPPLAGRSGRCGGRAFRRTPAQVTSRLSRPDGHPTTGW